MQAFLEFLMSIFAIGMLLFAVVIIGAPFLEWLGDKE